MQQESSGDEGDALTVADVHVVEGVDSCHLKENLLTSTITEEGVSREGARQVSLDIVIEPTGLKTNRQVIIDGLK